MNMQLFELQTILARIAATESPYAVTNILGVNHKRGTFPECIEVEVTDSPEIRQLADTCDKQSDEIRDLDNVVGDLQSDIEKLESKIRELENTLDDRKEEIDELESANKALSDGIDDRDAVIDDLNSEIRELNSDIRPR
jgi:chromosome segregation ATPase